MRHYKYYHRYLTCLGLTAILLTITSIAEKREKSDHSSNEIIINSWKKIGIHFKRNTNNNYSKNSLIVNAFSYNGPFFPIARNRNSDHTYRDHPTFRTKNSIGNAFSNNKNYNVYRYHYYYNNKGNNIKSLMKVTNIKTDTIEEEQHTTTEEEEGTEIAKAIYIDINSNNSNKIESILTKIKSINGYKTISNILQLRCVARSNQNYILADELLQNVTSLNNVLLHDGYKIQLKDLPKYYNTEWSIVSDMNDSIIPPLFNNTDGRNTMNHNNNNITLEEKSVLELAHMALGLNVYISDNNISYSNVETIFDTLIQRAIVSTT